VLAAAEPLCLVASEWLQLANMPSAAANPTESMARLVTIIVSSLGVRVDARWRDVDRLQSHACSMPSAGRGEPRRVATSPRPFGEAQSTWANRTAEASVARVA